MTGSDSQSWGECRGRGLPFGETRAVSPRKPLGTLQHGTRGSATTCSGSGKNLTSLGCLPPQCAHLSCGPQRCSPSTGFRSLQTRAQRAGNCRDRRRRTSPLRPSLAGLDGEKESGRQGILALGCSLFPAESWCVGGYRRQPLERLWLQPPPPLVGAGSGGGSHPGVTAPRPLLPRRGRSIKACWRRLSASHRWLSSLTEAPTAEHSPRRDASPPATVSARTLGQKHGLSDARELAPQRVL